MSGSAGGNVCICNKSLGPCICANGRAGGGGAGPISQHARDRAELRRLCAEIDTLRTANQRLEGEVARLTVSNANQTVRRFVGDDDQRQMDELVAAGIRVDQQEIKRLREALAGLVKINELHNQAVVAVTGKPGGWNDDYLNEARAALSTANGEVTE